MIYDVGFCFVFVIIVMIVMVISLYVCELVIMVNVGSVCECSLLRKLVLFYIRLEMSVRMMVIGVG